MMMNRDHAIVLAAGMRGAGPQEIESGKAALSAISAIELRRAARLAGMSAANSRTATKAACVDFLVGQGIAGSIPHKVVEIATKATSGDVNPNQAAAPTQEQETAPSPPKAPPAAAPLAGVGDALAHAIVDTVSQRVDQYMASAGITKDAVRALVRDAVAEVAKPTVVTLQTPAGEVRPAGLTHKAFPQLAAWVSLGVPVYLHGPAGTGKSFACEQLARSLGRPFTLVSFTSETPAAAVFGYQDAAGRVVRTPFRDGWESGAVILLDEADRAPADVLVGLNAALAQRRVAFPDGVLEAHRDTILVLAGNTRMTGADALYQSAAAQDGSTVDRLAFIEWQIDEALEEAAAHAHGKAAAEASGWNRDVTATVSAWVALVRAVRRWTEETGADYYISPRRSLQGAQALCSGLGPNEVALAQLWRRMEPDDAESAKEATADYADKVIAATNGTRAGRES